MVVICAEHAYDESVLQRLSREEFDVSSGFEVDVDEVITPVIALL